MSASCFNLPLTFGLYPGDLESAVISAMKSDPSVNRTVQIAESGGTFCTSMVLFVGQANQS